MSTPIEIILGDITSCRLDAIVNAANRSLLGGGGVDGAIHRAAGPQLLEACRSLNGCAPGEAKITKGYKLSARWVIHTVGPVWQGGGQGEDAILARCYGSCLLRAEKNGLHTIGFPSISTGAYGFPVERAAVIAIRETKRFLNEAKSVNRVVFVCFDDRNFETYRSLLH